MAKKKVLGSGATAAPRHPAPKQKPYTLNCHSCGWKEDRNRMPKNLPPCPKCGKPTGCLDHRLSKKLFGGLF